MTTKHTPGRWTIGEHIVADLNDSWIEGDQRLYQRAIYGADQVKIAVCEQWIGEAESAEAEANALLIAAAPDLLAALETVSVFIRGDLEHILVTPYDDGQTLGQMVRAALARARGE